VPPEFKVVCLACFDYLAYKAGVDYASHLRDVLFAGDRGSFRFQITTRVAVDPPPLAVKLGVALDD